MENTTKITALADLAIAVVYGGVMVYFLGRWVKYRKLPSVGVALLPLGWVTLSAVGLGVFGDTLLTSIKVVGLLFGIFLLWAVLSTDRVLPGPNKT